ncbi:uncharacterized protein LOC109143689 [Corvus cornix cornix]|uniref:uncharacterized protein LOC109143689 n=1 Tax=Corvus cornix cornix TaxID=932674 RepID=UPI0009015C15|nr:uncharacterized protein LOC109143689 [Corvus cornix cornix]
MGKGLDHLNKIFTEKLDNYQIYLQFLQDIFLRTGICAKDKSFCTMFLELELSGEEDPGLTVQETAEAESGCGIEGFQWEKRKQMSSLPLKMLWPTEVSGEGYILRDPDEVQCTQSMWQKFVWSSSSSYTNSLALTSTKGGNQTVLQVTPWLQQYDYHLFSSLLTCTLAVERLSKTVDRLKSLQQINVPCASSMDESLCYWEQAAPCSRERVQTTR